MEPSILFKFNEMKRIVKVKIGIGLADGHFNTITAADCAGSCKRLASLKLFPCWDFNTRYIFSMI